MKSETANPMITASSPNATFESGKTSCVSPVKAVGLAMDAEIEAFDPLPVPPTGLQSTSAKAVMTIAIPP